MRRATGIVLAGTLTALPGAVLPGAAMPGAAVAAERVCRASTAEGRHVARVLNERLGRVGADHWSLALRHQELGLRCTVRGTWRTESASIVKVAIVAALGMRRAEEGRGLSGSERVLARLALRQSDNAATYALWDRLGRAPGLRRFLPALRMRDTLPGPGTEWGRTMTSADSQLGLLRQLRARHSPVPRSIRVLILRHLRHVVPAQRWGMSAGLPAGTPFANKNGWRPGAPWGWRVHSTGVVWARTGTYELAILTNNNRSMAAGIRKVQRVARPVNRQLAAERG